jgi:peptidoglycan/LPS O-acetylase OafA/YrhL
MANTIAALLHGRDNNFNLIRFLAASAVIVDHSFALVSHDQTADALIDVERLEIGRLAVDVFFIISGFLVTRSVMTQPTLVDYAVARFLRLFPALLVACIGIAFVLGPARDLGLARGVFHRSAALAVRAADCVARHPFDDVARRVRAGP